jgi:uncharacterized protein (DUF1697 family)
MAPEDARLPYVALLRGINVSGQKKILMRELRDLCESIGLDEVATYVQSGNVVFNHSEDDVSLVAAIEDAIRIRFGFEVPVIVRSKRELTNVASSNPFLAEDGIDERHLCVIFLADEPSPARLDAIEVPGPPGDRFAGVGRHIYLHCPAGFARTKLSNNFFEKKLGLPATTRNWRTVNALFDMLKQR